MLWLLLFIVLVIIVLMVWQSIRSKHEWERELLYLTRHENDKEGVPENKDLHETFSPLFTSVRHTKPPVQIPSENEELAVFEDENPDENNADTFADLPIFAQEIKEQAEEILEKEDDGYFFPEEIEMPFAEQFKPFEDIEPSEPKVITLNTRTVYVPPPEKPQQQPTPEIISLQDVRNDLLRHRKPALTAAPQTPEPKQAPLPIIDSNEVLQNLSNTDSPINRKRKRMRNLSVIPTESLDRRHTANLSQKRNIITKKEALFTRFTPYRETAHNPPKAASEEENLAAVIAQIRILNQQNAPHVTPPDEPSLNLALVDEARQSLPSIEYELPYTLIEDAPVQTINDIPFIEEIDIQDIVATTEPEQNVSWSSYRIEEVASVETTPQRPAVVPVNTNHTQRHLPSVRLLSPPEVQTQSLLTDDILLERGILIEEKLAEFKVKVNVVDAYAGPVITRYEIEPAVGIRGAQVLNLERDLARALGLSSIRVVETIPGKTCMGMELPNPTRQIIRLSAILASPMFIDSRSKLTLALGQDITGQPVVTDLAKAPHLLVAGTTGSGKSVGVNAMILSLLFKATPEEVRLIMIDPKMLELSVYEGIPHLLAPVVTDMKLAANALTWCVNEMEKRYRLMSYMGVRNIAGFNQKIKEAALRRQALTNPFSLNPDDPEPLEPLASIVVVVDEFADLMMVSGKKIEELIARLAQKARAAGIHLILATQRPSVDVITGLIKANIPTRIAFQVSSKIDSRTILDQMGAENLLGQGDMLFLPPGTGYPQRVHGAFVADEEVHKVVTYLKEQFGEPNYIDDILTAGVEEGDLFSNANNGKGAEDDPLYDEAVALVLKTRKASISSVQRQLRIGYNRAARLIEQMEASGIVSGMENNGNRTVLVPDRGSE